jgi:hypothetical protein
MKKLIFIILFTIIGKHIFSDFNNIINLSNLKKWCLFIKNRKYCC